MGSLGHVIGGRYRLDRVLGQGGFGTVYQAEDLKSRGSRWAVKELNLAAGSPDEAREARAMMEQEQKVLSWLSHELRG